MQNLFSCILSFVARQCALKTVKKVDLRLMKTAIFTNFSQNGLNLKPSTSRCTIRWEPFYRYRPRFFDQVGHQTTYASMGNKQFFTKSYHCQTYQNYQQSRQNLDQFLENKVHILKIKAVII